MKLIWNQSFRKIEHRPVMIEAEHIHKSFGNVHVLNDVSFSVGKGEVVAIVGKSGAGKSTLLHITGTLEQPDEGNILFEGRNLNKLSSNKLSEFRNNSLGFIFQFHHLLPEFTALENVCIPAYIKRRIGILRKPGQWSYWTI